MPEVLNIYQKLQNARVEFQSLKISKSGQNKFSHYKYYELSDFLPTINDIFARYKLCSVISFGDTLATMTIYNGEKPEESIVITSPMSSAELKACHPVQNLGAVQTYQRRYLYMVALEIVESDQLEATTGDGKSRKETSKSEPFKSELPQSRKTLIARIVNGEPTVYPVHTAIMSARKKYLGNQDINNQDISIDTLIAYLDHIVEKYKDPTTE